MQFTKLFAIIITLAITTSTTTHAEPTAPQPDSPYAQWENGPPTDPNFFPIAVWLQSPHRAQRYANIGVNMIIGFTPSEEAQNFINRAGIYAIAHPNEYGIANKNEPIMKNVVAWMHGDEPDNARKLPDGSGYGPGVPTDEIQADYKKIVEQDPTRPVYMNMSRGMGTDSATWTGQGGHIDPKRDYPEYLKGCDIASFDIYPFAGGNNPEKGDAWRVALGVDRLYEYGGPDKIVWNIIECTDYSNRGTPATPEQVKAMAWMSIIHGSKGICYFVHIFQPKFNEQGLLADPVMTENVKELNAQITQLAPVINSPTLKDKVSVDCFNIDTRVDIMTKQYDGETYIFTANMEDQPTAAVLYLDPSLPQTGTIEVIDEDRTIEIQKGTFKDDYDGFGIHLYKIVKE